MQYAAPRDQRSYWYPGARSPLPAPCACRSPRASQGRKREANGSFSKGRGESRQGKQKHRNDLQLTQPCQHQSQAQQHLHLILKRTAEVARALVFLGQDTNNLQPNRAPRSEKGFLQSFRGGSLCCLDVQPLESATIPAGSWNSVKHRCQIRLCFEAALSPGKEERAGGEGSA